VIPMKLGTDSVLVPCAAVQSDAVLFNVLEVASIGQLAIRFPLHFLFLSVWMEAALCPS